MAPNKPRGLRIDVKTYEVKILSSDHFQATVDKDNITIVNYDSVEDTTMNMHKSMVRELITLLEEIEEINATKKGNPK